MGAHPLGAPRHDGFDIRKSHARNIALLRSVIIASLVALAACAQTLPPEPASARLYRDLQRLVTSSAVGDWGADRLELQGLLREGLDSVCRATPELRDDLLGWLDARIDALDGPVEQAWRVRGRDLGAVAELLEVTRIRKLLALAMENTADCPFWIEAEAAYRGRQIADDRTQLTLETGGRFTGLLHEGRFSPSGGPSGRATIGRHFGRHWGILGGIDLAPSVQFPRDQEAAAQESVRFALDLVIPVVARYRMVNNVVELEAGYLLRFSEGSSPASGYHLGLSFGLKFVRKGPVTPGLSFGVAFEQTLPSDEASLYLLKAGLRLTFDLDL